MKIKLLCAALIACLVVAGCGTQPDKNNSSVTPPDEAGGADEFGTSQSAPASSAE